MVVDRLVVLSALATGCGEMEYDLSSCKAGRVAINEVSAAAVDEEGEDDFVELYNGEPERIDLTGWTLSRVQSWREYAIPEQEEEDSGTEPGGFVTVLAIPYAPDDGTLATGFDLNRDGDGVWLRDDDGALCDYLLYPDQHASFSWGRVEDGKPEPDEASGCYQVPSEDSGNNECVHVVVTP